MTLKFANSLDINTNQLLCTSVATIAFPLQLSQETAQVPLPASFSLYVMAEIHDLTYLFFYLYLSPLQ